MDNNNLQNRILRTRQPILFLYGNVGDIYTENNLLIHSFLYYIVKETYFVEYFDASYNYPPERDQAVSESQYRYRAVDESCCNIEALKITMGNLEETPKCIIINLMCSAKDKSRESFLLQLPKVIQSECYNRMIIIGEQNDLDSLSNVRPSLEAIEIEKPTLEYLGRYINGRLEKYVASAQIKSIIRYCVGMYQWQVKRLLDSIAHERYSSQSIEEILNSSDGCEYSVNSEVTLDQVVGMEDAKEFVRRRLLLPFEHPKEFKALGVKLTGGALFIGPPGTGKTFFARAIANSVGAVLYQIRMSDVLSMWFGESEQRIRGIFEEARRQKRAVILIDEVDALTSKRDSESQTMGRLIAEILTQMQECGENVLIIGTTNRPYAMDTAMLRNGRFGTYVYVGLPNGENRVKMLEILIKNNGSDIDFSSLVAKTEGFNCADITALYNEAATNAISEYRLGNRENLSVTQEDFDFAFQRVGSTVRQQDVERIERWRKENGGVGVGI